MTTWRMDHLMKRAIEKPFVADPGRVAISPAVDEQRPEAPAVTTDPTLAGLLRAVLAEPDDDHARLVFADRCDELGLCERAEFIRAQVELARIETPVLRKCTGEDPATVPDPLVVRHADLCRRERGLLKELCLPLLDEAFGGIDSVRYYADAKTKMPGGPEVYAVLEYGDARCVFRRGFVESVTCTAADWERHADAILAAQPVREVRLTTFDNDSMHRKWRQGEYGAVVFSLPPGIAAIYDEASHIGREEYDRWAGGERSE